MNGHIVTGDRFNADALNTLRRIGNGGAFVRLIDLFLSTAPDRIEAARAGIATGDVASVELAAHSLKSSAAQFGGDALSRIAASMERAAETGELGSLPANMELLCAEFSEMKRWLEAIRDSAPSALPAMRE